MNPDSQTEIPKTKSKKPLVLICVGILLIFIVLTGIYIFLQNNKKSAPVADQQSQPTQDLNKTASLSTDPQEEVTKKGEVTTYSIWVDSGEQKIAAVEANLTYPADKFEFVSIDNSGSGYGINAEAKGGDGKISISKAQLGGTTGKQLLAKVNLKAKETGVGELTLTSESKVLTLSDNPQNILNTTNGATITIKE